MFKVIVLYDGCPTGDEISPWLPMDDCVKIVRALETTEQFPDKTELAIVSQESGRLVSFVL